MDTQTEKTESRGSNLASAMKKMEFGGSNSAFATKKMEFEGSNLASATKKMEFAPLNRHIFSIFSRTKAQTGTKP